jgi:hypothetical protein
MTTSLVALPGGPLGEQAFHPAGKTRPFACALFLHNRQWDQSGDCFAALGDCDLLAAFYAGQHATELVPHFPDGGRLHV